MFYYIGMTVLYCAWGVVSGLQGDCWESVLCIVILQGLILAHLKDIQIKMLRGRPNASKQICRKI